MRKAILKIINRLFPELSAGLHLPILAVVTEIPDPPTDGSQHSHTRPRYAVNLRILDRQGNIDNNIPPLRDIPAPMPAAGPDRGLAGLPQPGTVVELAFAFGLQSQPFIRTILPYGLKLPAIDAKSQKWQQSSSSYQKVDAAGNWTRTTAGDIFDTATNINRLADDILNQAYNDITNQAGNDIINTAENSIDSRALKLWLGSETINWLLLHSEHMQSIITALNSIASHTHSESGPTCQSDCESASGEISAKKVQLDIITKPPTSAP